MKGAVNLLEMNKLITDQIKVVNTTLESLNNKNVLTAEDIYIQFSIECQTGEMYLKLHLYIISMLVNIFSVSKRLSHIVHLDT